MSYAAEIRVGQSIDLTGENGDLGKDFLAGARVYLARFQVRSATTEGCLV
jgi:hypothetical protein